MAVAVALQPQIGWRNHGWWKFDAPGPGRLTRHTESTNRAGTTGEVRTLGSLYLFEEEDRVSSLLYADEELRSVLFDAYTMLLFEFGNNVQLVLAVEDDPEEGTDEQLVLFVYTDVRYDDARELLRQFDRDW